jgi:hypothetical protein
MKTLVWYVISSTASLISLAVFSEHIDITKVSAGILIMAIVSTVIAISMKESDAAGMNTVGLSDAERADCGRTISRSVIATIPLYFPLVFFFSDGLRIALGLAISIGGIVFGAVLFRVRFGDVIKSRQENEKCELEAAQKREEEGRL